MSEPVSEQHQRIEVPSVSKKVWVIVTLLAIAAAVGFFSYGSSLIQQDAAAKREQVSEPEEYVPEVATLRLEAKKVNPVVEATGYLRSPATIRVPVETNGKLLRKLKEEGDAVEKDELIAEIDESVWTRRLDATTARETSLKAQLEYVAKELEREEELERRGVGRLADKDRWLAEKRRVDAALLENAAVLAETRIFLEKCKIHASTDGVWFRDLAEEGEYLVAGTPLGLLRSLTSLELEVEVAGHVRLALERGARVDVEVLDVDTTLTDLPRVIEGCTVKTLPAGSSEASRRFPVVVEVPNADERWLPGLFAKVRFTLPRNDSILLVPKECVFDYYGRKAVYLLVGGGDALFSKLRYVDVAEVEDHPGSWRVVDGLEPGEQLIVEPVRQLSPDAIVRLRGTNSESGS